MFARSIASLTLLALAGWVNGQSDVSTFVNPIIPGWHSDPSCVYVPAPEDTFFCAVSTFLVFPGIPIFGSKDLINWKLVSHAWNRESQLPDFGKLSDDQMNGIYAPTLRYRDGTFYVITEYLYSLGNAGTIFKTIDPYDNDAWSDPVIFEAQAIDSDLFWDDDGTSYMVSAGILLQTIDVESGPTSEALSIWNGTGGVYPEGPHLYKKDGYYYLMIGEGGTELGHSETIARSKNISGPYESYENNPILTNRNTTEYFQTVGHADLFQDAEGNWWGVALSTRSGPAWKVYPMGRETVLFPAVWEEGEWPVLDPVRGHMVDAPLPPPNRNLTRGEGAFVDEPDVVDFEPGSAIPSHFVHWRAPLEGIFSVSSAKDAFPNTLHVTPSKANLTGSPEFLGQDGQSFIARRQTDTLFTFSTDLSFDPTTAGQEAGVTVFLTQFEHIDLGIVLLPSDSPNEKLSPHFRFRAEGQGNAKKEDVPKESITPIPAKWQHGPKNSAIRLQIQAVNETYYEFSAMPSNDPAAIVTLGSGPAALVSGGSGPFTGALVGAYATSNGGDVSGGDAYFGRWRYQGDGQVIE
jgi:beta-xylosidase